MKSIKSYFSGENASTEEGRVIESHESFDTTSVSSDIPCSDRATLHEEISTNATDASRVDSNGNSVSTTGKK